MQVKRFLLDTMRYNDNRGNDYSDDHYLATLMRCLAQSLKSTKLPIANQDPTLSIVEEAEEFEFRRKAIEELGRHQRLDEWIPTFQNIYTTTALECGVMLMISNDVPLKPSEFLQYTRIGNADNVRLNAWSCLLRLGMVKKDSVLQYMVHEIASDPSPYFRAEMLRTLATAIGQLAIGDTFVPEKPSEHANGGLVVVNQDEGPSVREADLARRKLDGALRALKADLEIGENAALKESLRKALQKALESDKTSVRDVTELLDICGTFITPVNKLEIRLKYPRYWNVQHLGNGQLRFYHSERFRTEQKQPLVAPQKEKVGLKLQLKTKPKEPSPVGEKVKTPRPVQEQPMAPLVQDEPPVSPIPHQPAVPPVLDQPAVSPSMLETPAPPPRSPSPRPKSPSPVLQLVAPPIQQMIPTLSPAPAAAPVSDPVMAPVSEPTPPPLVPTVSPTPPPAPVPSIIIPRDSHTATSTPRSTPTLKFTPAPKPTPPPKPPKAHAPKPKVKKPKWSQIITLKLAPELLSRFPNDSASRKRKAAEEIDGEERVSKRQASAEPSLARIEREMPVPGSAGRGKLMLKIGIGRNRLPPE